jgi:hypothetical protein
MLCALSHCHIAMRVLARRNSLVILPFGFYWSYCHLEIIGHIAIWFQVPELCLMQYARGKVIGHIGIIAMAILVAGICAHGFTCLIYIYLYS